MYDLKSGEARADELCEVLFGREYCGLAIPGTRLHPPNVKDRIFCGTNI